MSMIAQVQGATHFGMIVDPLHLIFWETLVSAVLGGTHPADQARIFIPRDIDYDMFPVVLMSKIEEGHVFFEIVAVDVGTPACVAAFSRTSSTRVSNLQPSQ